MTGSLGVSSAGLAMFPALFNDLWRRFILKTLKDFGFGKVNLNCSKET